MKKPSSIFKNTRLKKKISKPFKFTSLFLGLCLHFSCQKNELTFETAIYIQVPPEVMLSAQSRIVVYDWSAGLRGKKLAVHHIPHTDRRRAVHRLPLPLIGRPLRLDLEQFKLKDPLSQETLLFNGQHTFAAILGTEQVQMFLKPTAPLQMNYFSSLSSAWAEHLSLRQHLDPEQAIRHAHAKMDDFLFGMPHLSTPLLKPEDLAPQHSDAIALASHAHRALFAQIQGINQGHSYDQSDVTFLSFFKSSLDDLRADGMLNGMGIHGRIHSGAYAWTAQTHRGQFHASLEQSLATNSKLSPAQQNALNAHVQGNLPQLTLFKNDEILDVNAPTLKVHSPKRQDLRKLVSSKDNVVLHFSAFDDSFHPSTIKVFLNNIEITNDSIKTSNFYRELDGTAFEKENFLKITARDKKGNISTHHYVLFIDLKLPEIVLKIDDEPYQLERILGGSFEIKIQANDDVGISSFNLSSQALKNHQLTNDLLETINLKQIYIPSHELEPEQWVLDLHVQVEDVYGQVTEDTWNIPIDNRAPRFTVSNEHNRSIIFKSTYLNIQAESAHGFETLSLYSIHPDTATPTLLEDLTDDANGLLNGNTLNAALDVEGFSNGEHRFELRSTLNTGQSFVHVFTQNVQNTLNLQVSPNLIPAGWGQKGPHHVEHVQDAHNNLLVLSQKRREADAPCAIRSTSFSIGTRANAYTRRTHPWHHNPSFQATGPHRVETDFRFCDLNADGHQDVIWSNTVHQSGGIRIRRLIAGMGPMKSDGQMTHYKSVLASHALHKAHIGENPVCMNVHGGSGSARILDKVTRKDAIKPYSLDWIADETTVLAYAWPSDPLGEVKDLKLAMPVAKKIEHIMNAGDINQDGQDDYILPHQIKPWGGAPNSHHSMFFIMAGPLIQSNGQVRKAFLNGVSNHSSSNNYPNGSHVIRNFFSNLNVIPQNTFHGPDRSFAGLFFRHNAYHGAESFWTHAQAPWHIAPSLNDTDDLRYISFDHDLHAMGLPQAMRTYPHDQSLIGGDVNGDGTVDLIYLTEGPHAQNNHVELGVFVVFGPDHDSGTYTHVANVNVDPDKKNYLEFKTHDLQGDLDDEILISLTQASIHSCTDPAYVFVLDHDPSSP